MSAPRGDSPVTHSPIPRSASTGAGGGMPMSQPPQVNGAPSAGGSTPASAGGSGGVMSQQNLNQIVSWLYLAFSSVSRYLFALWFDCFFTPKLDCFVVNIWFPASHYHYMLPLTLQYLSLLLSCFPLPGEVDYLYTLRDIQVLFIILSGGCL